MVGIRWRTLFNYTRFLERLTDAAGASIASVPSPSPPPNPFRGRIAELCDPVEDASGCVPSTVNATLNALLPGAGTQFFAWSEDLAYDLAAVPGTTLPVVPLPAASRRRRSVVVPLSTTSSAIGSFWSAFAECHWETGHYCPLNAAASPATGCCSDRCEVRLYGTSLLEGLAAALLLLSAPFVLVMVCAPLAGFAQLVYQVMWATFLATWFMFAYGGGFICHFPAYALLALGLLRVAAAGLRHCCVRCGASGRTVARFATRFANAMVYVTLVAASMPGMSVCTGMDVYALVSDVFAPCAGLPPSLIDRTSAGSTTPCGTGGAGGPVPLLLNCAVPGTLQGTRFADGVDTLLYITATAFPGSLENALANSAALQLSAGVPGLGWLPTRVALHTAAAHAVDGDTTDDCALWTSPNLVLALLALALLLAFGPALLGALLFAAALLLSPLTTALHGTYEALWLTHAAWSRRRRLLRHVRRRRMLTVHTVEDAASKKTM